VPLTRQITIDNKSAYVFDGELTDAALKQLYRELSYDRTYARSETALAERIEIKHWATEFNVKEFIASEVGKRTIDLVQEYYPNEGQQPFRAYCNVATYGDMLSVHRDCAVDDKDVTALWFIGDVWERDWRGEFLLFDQNYDAQLAVTPLPGRLCLFRGALPHAGTPPSRLCYKPRLTLACKFSPTDERKRQAPGADRVAFSSVSAVFDHVARRLQTMPPKGIEATYKFVITGSGGGTWFVELTKAGGRVSSEDREGDLMITVSSETFLDAVNGRTNVAKAFVLGKVKVKGKLDIAIHLRDLLTAD
jgi:SM-20-related protein